MPPSAAAIAATRREAVDGDVDGQPGVVVGAREHGAHVGVAGQAAQASLAVEPLLERVGVDAVGSSHSTRPGSTLPLASP